PAREVLGTRPGCLVVPLSEIHGVLTRQTVVEPDHPVRVLLQDLAIDPGPAVEALQEPDGGELDEVVVTGAVLREEDEVRVRAWRVGGALAAMALAECEIRLEAEDRTDLTGPRLGVELPRAVQVAVVGDRERVHPERLDPLEQVGDPVGAVEERVLAVGVEVNERHTATRNYTGASMHCQKRAATDILWPHAPRREPVRAGCGDGAAASGDGEQSPRGAGHARARISVARGLPRRRPRAEGAVAPRHQLRARRFRRRSGVARAGPARGSGSAGLSARRRAHPDRPHRWNDAAGLRASA